jgi:hypothetical protein
VTKKLVTLQYEVEIDDVDPEYLRDAYEAAMFAAVGGDMHGGLYLDTETDDGWTMGGYFTWDSAVRTCTFKARQVALEVDDIDEEAEPASL